MPQRGGLKPTRRRRDGVASYESRIVQAAVNELVNEKVKRRMVDLTWSIRDVCAPLGRSSDWLWRRYEQRTNWSVADLVCVAEVLGLPARELVPDVAAATARAAALQRLA